MSRLTILRDDELTSSCGKDSFKDSMKVLIGGLSQVKRVPWMASGISACEQRKVGACDFVQLFFVFRTCFICTIQAQHV